MSDSDKSREQQRRRLDSILNSLYECIITIYDDKARHKFIWMPKELEKRYGVSADDFFGKSLAEIFPLEESADKMGAVLSVFKTGRALVSKIPIKLPVGEFWHEVSFTPVFDENGRVFEVVGFIRDITAQKCTQDALNESQEKLTGILESITDHMSMIDENHNIVWANDVTRRLFGPELIGKKCYAVYHRLNKKCQRCVIKKTFTDGKVHEQEREAIGADGNKVALWSTTSVAQWYDDGRPKMVVEISRNITERKHAEQALQYQLDFENLITEISTNFINLPIDRTDEGINQALKILGEFVDVDRSYIFQFFDDGEKHSNTYEWCADGVEPQIDNLQNLTSDDTKWWMDRMRKFENVYIPNVDELADEAGAEREILQAQSIKSLIAVPMVYNQQLFGFIGFDQARSLRVWSGGSITLLKIVAEIFVNTLMRKRAQEELNKYHEKMFRAEQLASLGTISTTIAHELNQPLTVIQLFLQQALRGIKKDSGLDGGKVVENINDSLEEVSRAITIVDRFRRYARKSSPMDVSETDLGKISRNIVTVLSERAGRVKLDLSMEIKDSPLLIRGDVIEFEQLFFVLIENAIQAANGKRRCKLAISAFLEDGRIQLVFADTCGGIEQANLKKIFEPFFTTKPARVSTGLGLCILERIVRKYGGLVRVESQIGVGSTFYVTLPIES